MAALLNELSTLSAELRSEKPTTRNKAAERLDKLLCNSKADLLNLYRVRTPSSSEVSWTELFNSAVCATLKHAVKVDESQDSKSIQTQRNKNYIFSGIVTKLMDYNLEEDNHFMLKSTIFTAFTEGLNTRSAIIHFGNLFLSLLERGIYKSPSYVRELKVNEYSRILSYLFELNIGNDEALRFATLRSITKTVELAVDHVQIGADLIDYLPEVSIFAEKANDDRRKAEVIRLFYLFVSQLAIDFHHTICSEIQELLPVMCGFYDFRMKNDIKEMLFHSINISLYAIYPHINKGDFNTFNIALKENWLKSLKMLRTMIDVEVKERKLLLYRRAGQDGNDKCLDHFVKMSALVVYLIYWRAETIVNIEDEPTESMRKIPRKADKIEVVLELVQQGESSFNEIWFAILTEMITNQENILNHTNYQEVLQTAFRILEIFRNANHMRNLRICFSSILRNERMLITTNCIPKTCCHEIWTKVVDLLLAESSSNDEIIAEKQILLQALIANSKLSRANCFNLLNAFMANTTLRRTECIATVQQMLIFANDCGLEKTSEAFTRFISWAYETGDRINVKSALLNIAPVDDALLADTCAIAVINFLGKSHVPSSACDAQKTLLSSSALPNSRSLQLFLYKHNRKFLCFEEHAQEVLKLKSHLQTQNEGTTKTNCLLQSNYEHLMRVLNIKTTNETTCSDILLDLSSLYKMACLMDAFLKYSVFDSEDYTQCPLIKRMGFFLSHLEFQLKSNDSRTFDRSDILEVLQRLEIVFTIFTSNHNLWQYLENQPLDELIEFLGKSLKYSATHHLSSEFDSWSSVTFKCLKILATLCSSRSHYSDSFAHISRYKFNIKADLNVILTLIKIFCSHTIKIDKIAEWFVEHLKTIFTLYHTHIETINEIVEILPAILEYVLLMDDQRQNMLIALISLLRIAYKKSYSTSLTAKLIGSVRQIARTYCAMWDQENFTNICLSVAKFLPFPSLEIQFATINTITALMDLKWLNLDTYELRSKHFDFYQQLIPFIDWKSLPENTIDLKENSNAVTIQVLVSMLVFSTCHQETALYELSNFCALRKLTAEDLHEFYQVAEYYNCTLSQLTKPYVANLIDAWSSKLYPILKFPYFLCCNTKDEFFQQNLSTIASCLLINGTVEDLKKLKKYATVDKLLEVSMPMISAISLPNKVQCPEEHQANYRQHIEKLIENLNSLGATLPTSSGVSSINWEAIYHMFLLFRDDNHFLNIFGFPLFCSQQVKWFNVNYVSLKRCLHYYINGSTDENTFKLFSAVIEQSPLNLVHVLGALKNRFLNSVFTIDRLKYLNLYCTITDMVVDSLPPFKNASPATKNSSTFFVRDLIFFSLHCLQKDYRFEVKKASLIFFHYILNKPVLTDGYCCGIIKTHLSDIIKTLVAVDDKSESAELGQLSVNLISFIINGNKKQISETIVQLEEFPMTEKYDKLRKIQKEMQTIHGNKDFKSIMKSFLLTKITGIESLKSTQEYISKNKCQLLREEKLLYDIVKVLLKIVHTSSDTDLSLEAVKFLGVIGSLKIENVSYFFQTDGSFYEDEAVSLDSMQHFICCMFVALDKLLLVFKQELHQLVCEVAQLLITSRHGEKAIGLFPYFNVFLTKTILINPLDSHASINIDWVSALKSTETLEYDPWICTFVSKIFEMCGWKAFRELATQNLYFADAALQPLIKLFLSNKERHLDSLTAMLNYFFTEFANNFNLGIEALNCKTIFKDKRIISKFLNICECIRIHNDWKLPINLLLVAKACNYCQAYFMSIIYLEMWALDEKSKTGKISKSEIMVNDSFQESATKAYQSIGCTNAISGFLNPLQSRLNFLNLNNNWSEILIEASAGEIISDQLYTSVLKRNGMLTLAGLNQTNKPVDYEVCWRLGQWDTIVEGHLKINTLNDMEQEFEKHHFNALKCLNNREENNSLAAIANARHCVLFILREISVECLQSVYKYLTWLQLLQQTEDFCQVQFATANSVNEIFERWQVDADFKYGNFNCKEQILSHQIALFKTAGVRANRKITDHYKENPTESCLLKCIRECKKAGEVNLAKRNIASLRNMQLSSDQIKASVLLEDAEVCLQTGKPQITVAILNHLIKNNDIGFCLHRVRALRMHGEYLMESNTDTFETVLKSSFNSSLDLIKKISKSKEQILQKLPNFFDLETFDDFEQINKKRVYNTIAKYADKEYTQLNTYANSDEFEMKCKIIKKNRQAADLIGRQNKDRDKNVGAVYMKKFANLDEEEVKSIDKKRTDNLCIAVENYINYCKVDDAPSSSAIYRIIALWFANKQNESLLSKIREYIVTVPSYKFICALNQMTARLNSNNQDFIDVLKDLLVRCAVDHPHHTLYQLYPLVFAYSDSSSTITKNYNRVQIAKEIISRAKNKSNGNSTKQLENMFPALIEFANFEVGDNKHASIALSDKLLRLKNLDAVQCPTLELPISANKNYNITGVVKWEEKISLVGGINAPKKLICLCTDGIARPQLLKGKDDLRQDAVMQQVFSMINDLLKSDPLTIEHTLMMRTYKVVPLSMRSGILEWCQNTIPIGLFLTDEGKGGAHKKYHPKDYSTIKCRGLAMQHLKSDAEKRYQMYKHICDNIQPVFHYFFFEKFLVPGVWFERRLAYTNSVATTSIVGFILGLGDRHVQNILIDELTGEVIHIDFGIAFEQGKIMPTPETVPFRLTRDMVSPMGVCETNGIFKKSCEITMQILRRNQAVITTILEVLLYDPLYIWKVVPQNADTDNESADEETNLTAQRALLCVQNKLEGKQAGILGTSEVDVQVQRLINDAISSRNLSQLFPGWDPYL